MAAPLSVPADGQRRRSGLAAASRAGLRSLTNSTSARPSARASWASGIQPRVGSPALNSRDVRPVHGRPFCQFDLAMDRAHRGALALFGPRQAGGRPQRSIVQRIDWAEHRRSSMLADGVPAPDSGSHDAARSLCGRIIVAIVGCVAAFRGLPTLRLTISPRALATVAAGGKMFLRSGTSQTRTRGPYSLTLRRRCKSASNAAAVSTAPSGP